MSAGDDVVVVVVDKRMSRRKQDLRPLDFKPAKRRKGRAKKTKGELTEAEKLIKIAKKMGQPMDIKLDSLVKDANFDALAKPKVTVKEATSDPVTAPKVTIKKELDDEDDCYEYEYLDELEFSHQPIEVKTEIMSKHVNFQPDLPVKKKENYIPEEYIDDDVLKYEYDKGVHRYTMVKPHERHSYVEDLRKKHPEFGNDEKALIRELKRLLDKQTKPRPIPEGVLGICEETSYHLCKLCGERKQTLIAATRHYQEKHGPRYLHCFACGVDFRSLTNLYKHEKRCAAPDARLVLRARALVVERRSMNRPFALPKKKKKSYYVNKKFRCSTCSAEYSCRVTLEAHEAAHRGARPHACPHCARAYTARAALRKHILTHFEKRFECDHCGAKFHNKPAIATHMAKHMGAARVPCPDCDKVYCSRDRLRLHRDVAHLHAPPQLACVCCTKRYRRTYDLKRHMLRAHQMKLFTKKMFYQNLPKLSNTTVTGAVVINGGTILEEQPIDSVTIKKDQSKNKKEDIRTFLRETVMEEMEIEISQGDETEIITGDLDNGDDSQNFEDTQDFEDSQNYEDLQNEDTMQGEFVDENNCEVIEDEDKLNDILKESDKYQVYMVEKGKMTKKLNLKDIKDQLLKDYKIKDKK